jgi:hypothetical protein
MPQGIKNAEHQPWFALLFICLSLLVISLNNNILNIALPSMLTYVLLPAQIHRAKDDEPADI